MRSADFGSQLKTSFWRVEMNQGFPKLSRGFYARLAGKKCNSRQNSLSMGIP